MDDIGIFIHFRLNLGFLNHESHVPKKQLVQDDEQILDSMEIDPLIVDSSDDESKVVKLSDAQKYTKDILNFMASQGSQIFSTHELLEMEKIHDKLIRIGVAHLISTKECDIRTFFVSSERSLPDLNDTL